MTTRASTVAVVQDPDKPVPREILAEALVRIGEAFVKLRASGLNRRAIVLLVSESSGQTRGAVGDVLDALESLSKDYCR